MKKKRNNSTLFLSLLIFVVLISCVRQEERPKKEIIQPSISTQKDTIFYSLKGFPVLFPVNEAAQQPLLEATIERLLVIVKKKDEDSLLSYISDDIQINFNEKGGLKAFKTFWKLSERPEDSEIWSVLEKILRLGGTFYHEEAFFMPYTFSLFPAEYNPDDFGVVTGERVLMRAGLDRSSDTIAELAYEIVRILKKEGNWINIKRQNEMVGYVESQDISCPTDYRLGWKLINGAWKINLLVK